MSSERVLEQQSWESSMGGKLLELCIMMIRRSEDACEEGHAVYVRVDGL